MMRYTTLFLEEIKMPNENLGPAERIINALLAYSDHMVHNRPGIICPDATSVTGVKWSPVTYKVEGADKVVYRKDKLGKKTNLVKIGNLQEDGRITSGATTIGRYMTPGLFPEVASWMYRQIAEVYKLDNEFAARWASYAYNQDHRDLKIALAAFMLVQTRKGDPVLDNGKVAFYDEDFRDVGEAMILNDGAKFLDVKMVLRLLDFLQMPAISAINRELGFGQSARHAFLGRLPKVIDKWLRYREENPKMLAGLVKKGFRSSLIRLARSIGYKPTSDKFFTALRWKQVQAKDGHRSLAIGKKVKAAESWAKLTEEQICEKIVATKIDFKQVIGRLPEGIGLTRAIMAAAIEAGSLSDKDLILYSPTLEELGLLKVPEIQGRWQAALKKADDQRAANVALRMKSKESKEQLQTAADTAIQKVVEEAVKDLEVYVIVDISGSMEEAIEKAKKYVSQMVPAFPLDRLHVSVHNTTGREVKIPHASAAGVNNAFSGIKAGGGTDIGSGVTVLAKYKPGDGRDALLIFVGDEGAPHFTAAVQASGLNPIAFGLIPTPSPRYGRGTGIRDTAVRLGIPCFEIDERTFSDPYAVPRTLRHMIAATPVTAVTRAVTTPRVTLVDTILATPMLSKPAWAA